MYRSAEISRARVQERIWGGGDVTKFCYDIYFFTRKMYPMYREIVFFFFKIRSLPP